MPVSFFFFNDTATTEIYTLSLHDALPISLQDDDSGGRCNARVTVRLPRTGDYTIVVTSSEKFATGRFALAVAAGAKPKRSEEHTSELQSRLHLVCRLLLEKKNINYTHSSS